MKNSNHNQIDFIECRLSESSLARHSRDELLVTILYGEEISQSEKIDFFEHLPDCAVCCAEFAAFQSIRNLFDECPALDFGELAVPQVTFSPKKKTVFEKTVGNLTFRNWLRSLSFSTLNFRWQGAVLLAVLTACITVLFLMNFAVIEGDQKNLATEKRLSKPEFYVQNQIPLQIIAETNVARTDVLQNRDSEPDKNAVHNSNNKIIYVSKPNESIVSSNLQLNGKNIVISRDNSKLKRNRRSAAFSNNSAEKQLTLIEETAFYAPDDTNDVEPRLSDLFDELEPNK